MDGGLRLLVAEAALCLCVARLALIVIPFPRLAPRLGDFVAPGDPRAVAADAPAESEARQTALRVRLAIGAATRNLPLKIVCLPQAMAAQFMLRRRGIACVMHFGAAKVTDKPLDAHAWLDAAGVKVTGYPVGAAFAEIACFV